MTDFPTFFIYLNFFIFLKSEKGTPLRLKLPSPSALSGSKLKKWHAIAKFFFYLISPSSRPLRKLASHPLLSLLS